MAENQFIVDFREATKQMAEIDQQIAELMRGKRELTKLLTALAQVVESTYPDTSHPIRVELKSLAASWRKTGGHRRGRKIHHQQTTVEQSPFKGRKVRMTTGKYAEQIGNVSSVVLVGAEDFILYIYGQNESGNKFRTSVKLHQQDKSWEFLSDEGEPQGG